MRRDMDLIRELMLRLEDHPVPHDIYAEIELPEKFEPSHALAVPDYDVQEIRYHVRQLLMMKLVDGQIWRPTLMTFHGLTPAGHDFVDSIREPKVWTETKSRAERVGSWTFSILRDTAVAIIKGELRKHGMPID